MKGGQHENIVGLPPNVHALDIDNSYVSGKHLTFSQYVRSGSRRVETPLRRDK